MKRSNLIIVLIVILASLTFWFYGYKAQNEEKKIILEKGVFTIGIIKKVTSSQGGMKHFYSDYFVSDIKYELKYNTVSQKFYNLHNAGDTIIIKYFPNQPEISTIIDDEAYKTCYGIPPKNGWRKIPIYYFKA